MEPNAVKDYQGLLKGGQTGADRGGLEAARSHGIETGGTAPKDFMTEDGPDPSLSSFHLVEGTSGYIQRTKQNVEDSDGTIAFLLQRSTGTNKTIGYALNRKWEDAFSSSDNGFRPVLVLNSTDPSTVQSTVDFLVRNKIKTVNIAGNRRSTSQRENFTQEVNEYLQQVFEKVKRKAYQ